MALPNLIRKLLRLGATEEEMRNPNWCWMHSMMWPACEGMH